MTNTYRGGQNLTSLFYDKHQFDQEKLDYLRFIIFAITMELHCNGKNTKSPINPILVLLYMWVTYELIQTSFSVQTEDFRFLEILAITNPIVN